MSIEGKIIELFRADADLSALLPNVRVGEMPSPELPYAVILRGGVNGKTDTNDCRLENLSIVFTVYAEHEDTIKTALGLIRKVFHRSAFDYDNGRCYAMIEQSGATETPRTEKGLWIGRVPYVARTYEVFPV